MDPGVSVRGSDSFGVGPVPTGPASRVAPLSYIPALDGLRALAVLVVLGYHSEIGWLGGGFLGVSAFFTLSGFLITSILLRESGASGRIDLRRFWSRRFRRLLPASWATVALVIVLGAAGIWDTEQLRSLRGDVPWSLGEMANWHFVAVGDDYAASAGLPSPLLHFWSLAVEQQFYLLWPLVIAAAVAAIGAVRWCRARPRTALAGVLSVGIILSAAANGVFARWSVERAYFGTDTRAAEILVGALLAVATTTGLRFATRRARTMVGVAGVAGMVGLGWLVAVARVPDSWLYPWGLLGTAGCTVAVLSAALQPGLVSSLLSVRPLVALGRISYGVYLVHWPVFLWLTAERTGIDGTGLLALRVVVTLLVASASYRFLEEPIRSGRRLNASTIVRVAPAALGVLVIGGVVVTAALPAPPGYLQRREEGAIAIRRPDTAAAEPSPSRPARPREVPAGAASPGAPTRPVVPPAPSAAAPSTTPDTVAPVAPSSVLLVGDSVAASLEDSLGDELVGRGVAFASAAAPGCGVVRGFPTDEQGRVVGAMRACDAAVPARQLEAVAAAGPDLVLVMSTWEMTNRELDGTWYRFGTPDADLMLERLLTEAVDRLSSRGAAVAFVLMPEPVDGATQRTDPIEVGRSRHLNRVVSSVARRHPARVTSLPFDRIVCPSQPCPAVVDGLQLRGRDGRHFDDPAAAGWAAGRLANLVTGLDLGII